MASETNETREKSLNFLEEIIEESIAKGKTRVQTRFPPEPNGYLHIGHAKSICINFGLAKKYGGKCNLRFDDTNPVKEDVEYVDSIKRDIHWLGFDWAVERYASDYFDQLYDWFIQALEIFPSHQYEFERADRVGDLLDRVALAVGVVVHRVDAPFVARAVMLGVDDAVHDRVAEQHVGVCHVDLGAQDLFAVGEFALLHALEQVEVLLDGAVAPR